jgi:hypothetical protein
VTAISMRKTYKKAILHAKNNGKGMTKNRKDRISYG